MTLARPALTAGQPREFAALRREMRQLCWMLWLLCAMQGTTLGILIAKLL